MGLPIAKFKLESFLIDRLKKTAAEFSVNLKSRPDNSTGLDHRYS
jgi:hypothetical protein